MDEEENDAGVGEELQRWSEVGDSEADPIGVDRSQRESGNGQLAEMPAIEVGCELEDKESDGEKEEDFDKGVDTGTEMVAVSGVSAASGKAAADGGDEGEEGPSEGSEAAGGAVGFEEENPSDLLSILIPANLGSGGAREGRVFISVIAGELHHGPVRVLHLHHHWSSSL